MSQTVQSGGNPMFKKRISKNLLKIFFKNCRRNSMAIESAKRVRNFILKSTK